MGGSQTRGAHRIPPGGSCPFRPATEHAPLLLLQARKLEGDLDIKIAAFGKAVSGFEYGYAKGESGLATDQSLVAKSSELDTLLSRLSDVNDSMRSCVSGSADSRSHMLTRHRDILHDFTQEFRRLAGMVSAARDRADLLGAAGPSSPLLNQSSMGLLLRERGALANSNAAVSRVGGDEADYTTFALPSLCRYAKLFSSINAYSPTKQRRWTMFSAPPTR
jgi:hypothetical protein